MQCSVELVTEDDVRRLLRACATRSATGLRNRALIVLLYCGGLKVGEALRLAPEDVDHRRQTVFVRGPRGGRTVRLSPGAVAVVMRWASRRVTLRPCPGAPLLCTRQGGAVDPSYVRHLLPRLGRRARLEKRGHAEGLRRARAIALATRRRTPRWIQRQLGYASRTSTFRSLATVAPLETIVALGARNAPRRGSLSRRRAAVRAKGAAASTSQRQHSWP